jgi:hypothetical protein
MTPATAQDRGDPGARQPEPAASATPPTPPGLDVAEARILEPTTHRGA